ncbi:MAG: hypothetical protein CM1200mP18_12370 [Gammaproteobacteria bacterium]|nr:MAG: hypothetical protein CM1200mP18_12370 [Gammaproteobacteria bacterium]
MAILSTPIAVRFGTNSGMACLSRIKNHLSIDVNTFRKTESSVPGNQRRDFFQKKRCTGHSGFRSLFQEHP